MNCNEWVFILITDQEISHAISSNMNFNCCTVVIFLLARNDIAVSASRQTSLQSYIQRPLENIEMQQGLLDSQMLCNSYSRPSRR